MKMMKMMKMMNVSLWSGIALLGCSVLTLGQNGYKFDAATVSGLPARNIGSATMSGRVAAIDAVEQLGAEKILHGLKEMFACPLGRERGRDDAEAAFVVEQDLAAVGHGARLLAPSRRRAMITRMISLVPSRIWCTRTSRKWRSMGKSLR